MKKFYMFLFIFVMSVSFCFAGEKTKGQLVAEQFKKIFKNIITVNSAEEALDLFEEHQADIVITDINMGKLNGLELSKKIKKINLTK